MTNARQALAMSEADFQRTVLEMAAACGWRRFHARKTARTRRDGAIVHHTSYSGDGGFPDLVLAHPQKGVIFAELKSERGSTTDAQDDWLAVLRTATADCGQTQPGQGRVRVYIWRPSDMDAIEELLR